MRKIPRRGKLLLIALAALVILGAGSGLTAYFLLQPRPIISADSSFHMDKTPVGATLSVFQVSAQHFAANSKMTFLLDGRPAPGNQQAKSDANGNVRIFLLYITSDWSLGKHVLTAQDASGHTSTNSVTLAIVPQGQDDTTGPFGTPADDASFTILVMVLLQNTSTNQTLPPEYDKLTITGRPDPDGGFVCRSFDDGAIHTFSGVATKGITYIETSIHTCSGTYKNGHLTYTETAVSDQIVYSNGLKCTVETPRISRAFIGDAISPLNNAPYSFAGTFRQDSLVTQCNQGVGTQRFAATTGTWTTIQ